MLPWEKIGQQWPVEVVATTTRKERLHPAAEAFLPRQICERTDRVAFLKLFVACAGNARIADARGRLWLRFAISHADRNRHRRLDVDNVFGLARSEVVTFEVNDPEFIKGFAHFLPHS